MGDQSTGEAAGGAPAEPSRALSIVAICGSLRRGSFNAALLRTALELAPADLEFDRYDGLRAIPPFDDDVRQQGLPDAVADLAARIDRADGVLIATPEYNFGLPGVLKNALDWVSCAGESPYASPLRHKAVGMMGASAGLMGTVRAQQGLRALCHFTDSQPMLRPEVFVQKAWERFDGDGRLVDEPTRALVETFMTAFRDFVSWRLEVGPPPAAPVSFVASPAAS